MYYYLTNLRTLNLTRVYNIYWSFSTYKYKQDREINAFFHQFSDGVRVSQATKGQIISKCPFSVYKSPKKRGFLP